ncbi:MAG: tryptophan synthase subunit alpha [Kiritimatiellae bacterium]|nr:tryptophan synthase subunit alpha [Kiritimatiellia bacterium]
MKTARISNAFAKAKAEGRGAFVAYLTMGFPTVEASERAADEAIENGADVLELGVPFSDPFADGGVIRSAAYEALKNGVTLADIIALAGRIRAKHPETGLVLFSYYNPVFSMGLDKFAAAVADAGIDAVLVVDLPLEEREELLSSLRPHDIGFVPLIAPNTPIERVMESEKGIGDSFLYVITVKGTTGARTELPPDLAQRLDAIRSVAHLPIAAGFGISTRAQAEEVSRHADGFIVGSALVKCVAEGKPPCLS